MRVYTCNACMATSPDPDPCILTVGHDSDIPCLCPYDPDIEADWNRVCEPAAEESEAIIHDYLFRATHAEINSKDDVKEVISALSDCITDLLSIDWPEDIERRSRIVTELTA